jgi:hypothetical protein
MQQQHMQQQHMQQQQHPSSSEFAIFACVSWPRVQKCAPHPQDKVAHKCYKYLLMFIHCRWTPAQP